MEFGDYHDSYLTTNVLKLADIFEVSLDTCMNYYGLHHATLIRKPWISFTGNTKDVRCSTGSPHWQWHASFHLTENTWWSGNSTTRYVKASNHYLDSYLPCQERETIIHLDKNNLYGWAMSQSLPGGKWNNSIRVATPPKNLKIS